MSKVLVIILRKFHFVPNGIYLKLIYRLRCDAKLNLTNPSTFNEKLQWIKLYGFKLEYTQMADKYRVREYIAEKLHPYFEVPSQFLVPLLGVWNKFDDINFDTLPEQFVLKTNHDSGGVVICNNRHSFDALAAKKKLSKSLGRNYYWSGRETCYRDIKPVIIAEELLGSNVSDYKIHCFGGVPRFIQVIGDRDFKEHSGKAAFYSPDWERIEMIFYNYPEFEFEIPKPNSLGQMIKIASLLSEGIAYCRVDLYEIQGCVKFGEITFYPLSGMYKYPVGKEGIGLELGKMIVLEDQDNMPATDKTKESCFYE